MENECTRPLSNKKTTRGVVRPESKLGKLFQEEEKELCMKMKSGDVSLFLNVFHNGY